jgi:hypothetical protein
MTLLYLQLHNFLSTQDFAELFPSYEEGDIYDKKSGWRKLGEWFYPDVAEYDEDRSTHSLSWQVRNAPHSHMKIQNISSLPRYIFTILIQLKSSRYLFFFFFAVLFWG